MWKVWVPFRDQLKKMQETSFALCGKEDMIILVGDFHFLDDMLGHQGSSATWPSSLDKVRLSHLQADHKGNEHPHTPLSCPIEERNIQDYVRNYNENLVDDRNDNDMRKHGPDHFSVIAPMLFPLKSLKQLVPPGLHIMLGVVLLIYNLLLQMCQK